MATPTRVLCQDTVCEINEDITLADGTVLKKGTTVLLLPQTTSACVLVAGDKSLEEAWDTLSKVGHVHTDDQANLVAYSAELVRYADRLAGIEAWAVANGYVPPTQGV